MPAFNAATVVEPLDFDFSPHVPVKGTIKEPADQQIAEFLAAIKKLGAEMRQQLPAGLDDPNDTGQLLAAMDELEPEVMISFMARMAGVYAELTSGLPSEAQILQLPTRIRNVFYEWLQGEVMDPEAVTGGGTQQAPSPRR